MVGIQSSLRTSQDMGQQPGWEPGGEAGGIQIPSRSLPSAEFPRSRRERSGADLARMIESEIIPRLMLCHSAAGPASQAGGSVGARTLEAFARMTLASEAPTLTAYVEALIQGGLSLEEIYVDLLIPTARRLGDDWNEDVISFTEVTIGLSRLQQVVRALGRSLPSRDADGCARSVYLAPAPAEQHAFGLVVLEDYFRRAGWRTWLDTAATADDSVRTVAQEWFDVFGLSATSDTPTRAIAATIARVREASLNRSVFVMVGGRLFIEDPALVDAVGADAFAETAADALSLAHKTVKAHAFA